MKRLYHIDALRGFAALAVAWFHFTKNGPTDYEGAGVLADLITASGSKGWLGVEVFFVISGFILPYTMAKGGYQLRDFGTFVKKRILRLDPPYFVAIVLALLLWWAGSLVPAYQGDPFAFEPIRLLLHLGYLNAFFDYPWYNVVFWTLAIEFQFYLLLAIGFPVLLHRRVSVRLTALAIMCGSAFLIPGGNLVFHYLGLFALGVISAHYALGLIATAPYLSISVLIAVVTAAATSLLVAGVGVASALFISFVRFREVKVLAWLGAISYSLYLLHVPIGGRVLNLSKRFADTLPLQVVALVVAVAASLIAAHLLWRFVELPSQRLSSSVKYVRHQHGADSSKKDPAKEIALRGTEISMP